jgi:hypothetical protein
VIFLLVGKSLINRIPLATLAAVLIYVGWRLCEPTLWAKVLVVGKEQLLLFVFTVASLLAVDLLVGIIACIVAKALMLLYLQSPTLRDILTTQISLRQLGGILLAHLKAMFATPVRRIRVHGGNGRDNQAVYLSSATSFNLLKLEKYLESIPQSADITVVFTRWPGSSITRHWRTCTTFRTVPARWAAMRDSRFGDFSPLLQSSAFRRTARRQAVQGA